MGELTRRLRLTLASVGIGIALVLLMVTSIRAASTYYYTLSQFRAMGAAATGRYVKVNGLIGPGPVYDPASATLTFTVVPDPATGTPAAGVAQLPVTYHGSEPDTFAPGISVVVAGTMTASGTFVARQVLVKCPSHYTAATPAGSA